MSSDPDLLAELTACEMQVWDALVSGDASADDAALSPLFLGVYPDGFAQKADHVAQLADGPTVLEYALDDLRVLPLGSDYAVLSYHARFRRLRKNTAEVMYVSSIWERSATGWRNVFSQDTPATR